jgi:hypothetical protein
MSEPPETVGRFKLFAELIAFPLDTQESLGLKPAVVSPVPAARQWAMSSRRLATSNCYGAQDMRLPSCAHLRNCWRSKGKWRTTRFSTNSIAFGSSW